MQCELILQSPLDVLSKIILPELENVSVQIVLFRNLHKSSSRASSTRIMTLRFFPGLVFERSKTDSSGSITVKITFGFLVDGN